MITKVITAKKTPRSEVNREGDQGRRLFGSSLISAFY